MVVDTSKQGRSEDYWLGDPVETSNKFEVLAQTPLINKA
jgi:hypothetical protein